jgi:DNA-binding NarL/FixJ family response regulator
MERPIRTAVAVAHAGLRAALVRFLSGQPGLQVVGEAATLPAIVELLNEQDVDAVVLDAHLPSATIPGLLSLIRAQAPRVPIILLTPERSADYEKMAARWGVAACVAWAQADLELVGRINALGLRQKPPIENSGMGDAQHPAGKGS